MIRTAVARLACWIALVSLAGSLPIVERPVLGAEGKPPVKKLSRRGHRLPAHYAKVVNDKQRQEIYRIKDEYQPKIEALQNQLNALKKERDKRIAALLTAEQKKQIEEAVAKAAANRKSKRKSAAKPAEQTPAAPPATPAPVKQRSER